MVLMPDFVTWWLDHWPLIPVLIWISPSAWAGLKFWAFDPFMKGWHEGQKARKQDRCEHDYRLASGQFADGVMAVGEVNCLKCDKRQDAKTVSEYGDPVIGFDGPAEGKP